MPYKEYSLPKYPCTLDMWDKLREETRPIVVYGMGNGADKLIKRFSEYGIKIADFFASDGFVRGHSFHGFRVKSFSEIKALYPEFVIVLSFASNKSDVVKMLGEMSENYDMYIPDMPIADENIYFDRELYNAHYEEILAAYSALCDQSSKNLFAAMLNYKLTGRAEYLLSSYSEKSELYSLLPTDKIENIIDVGAYNGDTLREAVEFFPRLKRATLIEPDPKSFKKLTAFTEALENISINAINAAAWSEIGEAEFSSSGNRNSTATATVSFKHKSAKIPFITVDSTVTGRVDYIKYDVEGAEANALIGSHETIKKYNPALLISLYHKSCDLFALINDMKEKYPEYDLYLRRLYCLPAWELDLIMLPKTNKSFSDLKG